MLYITSLISYEFLITREPACGVRSTHKLERKGSRVLGVLDKLDMRQVSERILIRFGRNVALQRVVLELLCETNVSVVASVVPCESDLCYAERPTTATVLEVGGNSTHQGGCPESRDIADFALYTCQMVQRLLAHEPEVSELLCERLCGCPCQPMSEAMTARERRGGGRKRDELTIIELLDEILRDGCRGSASAFRPFESVHHSRML